MIKIYSSVAVALIMTGCMSSQINSPQLAKSQKAYERIKQDVQVNRYAAPSLFQAGKLYTLSRAVKSEAEAKHFAYLLEKEVAVAQENTKTEILREKLGQLKEYKIKAILDAKEDELKKAKEEARLAQEEARGLEQKYHELQELNAKMTSRGLVLTLGDVLFENNRATLMVGAMRAIDKLVAFLSENAERKVLIEGHTDNVGSSTYNIDLSLRRAEAVSKTLINKGIEASRVVTRGYGEAYPVTENSTDAGKQQNRRVEIVILNEGDTVEDIQR